jgi:hypothetical protein
MTMMTYREHRALKFAADLLDHIAIHTTCIGCIEALKQTIINVQASTTSGSGDAATYFGLALPGSCVSGDTEHERLLARRLATQRLVELTEQ